MDSLLDNNCHYSSKNKKDVNLFIDLTPFEIFKNQSIFFRLTAEGPFGPSVITLANYEGLAGHAQSVKIRLKGK